MKNLLIPFVLFAISLSAQETPSKIQVNALTNKVKKATNKERLLLLDSLTSLVWRKKGFPFDSLAKETINLSLQLDSADLAAYHTVNRMYYFTGAKGDLITSEKIFLEFEENYISKVKKNRRLANFYKAGGLQYYNMNKYDKAIHYYDKALLSAVKTTDSQAIGEIYMGKGMVFYSQGKLIESSQNLQKSIPYFKASGGVNAIINVKNIMVSLYSENGFYKEAEKERKEAIKLAKKEEHHLFLSQIFFNYSVELRTRGKLKERIKYLEMALNEVEQSRYKVYYKPIYLAGMVIGQAEVNNISSAKKYWDLLEKEERKNAPGETTSFYKEAKMRLAFAEKNYKEALIYGQDYYNYKTEIKQFDGLENADQFLAKVYSAIGDDKKANEYLRSYQKRNDSITGLKKAKILSYYQTLYETEKRDAKIIEQQSEITLLDAKNRIKNQRILFGAIGLILIFIIIFSIRSYRFAKKKQLLEQQFARDLLQEQEKERKRFSKELHDGVGQNLLLIKNSLTLNPDKTPKLVDKTIEDIRSISRNLHPIQLEKFGLTKAIENIVEDLNDLTTIFFSDEIENIDNFFPKEKEIYLYRIIQECFNNIMKHSGATAAKINIKKDENKVTITIQDNGSGFNFEKNNEKQKSFGLKSLQERVAFLKGNISFDSEKNKGTTITIISYK
ncbi:tetratricopeptide repeat-containing sensor histidine kinase [Lutibacter sp.]